MPWLEPNGRPSARTTQLRCSPISNPQKLRDNKCLLCYTTKSWEYFVTQQDITNTLPPPLHRWGDCVLDTWGDAIGPLQSYDSMGQPSSFSLCGVGRRPLRFLLSLRPFTRIFCFLTKILRSPWEIWPITQLWKGKFGTDVLCLEGVYPLAKFPKIALFCGFVCWEMAFTFSFKGETF